MSPYPSIASLRASRGGENANEDKAHGIAIRIVDEFEDLLDEEGIVVPSADREGRPGEACLCGTEYCALGDDVFDILMNKFGEKAEDASSPRENEQTKVAWEARRHRKMSGPSHTKASELSLTLNRRIRPSHLAMVDVD